jgi:hypothetical protein
VPVFAHRLTINNSCICSISLVPYQTYCYPHKEINYFASAWLPSVQSRRSTFVHQALAKNNA